MTETPSLPDLLRASAAKYPDHLAIRFQGRNTTHAAFDAATDRVAAGLYERGIRKGDRIGLYCANSDAFAMAYFGILKAGGTVVPVNLLMNPKEIAYVLNDAGASMVIYLDVFAAAVQAFRSSLPPETAFVCIGEMSADESDLPFASLVGSTADCPAPSIEPSEDVAVNLYTSGTTGYPKGAMLTHRNLASNARSISIALKLEPGRDVLLVVLPMFHAFAATVGMIYPLLNGCTLVPVPKFDPQLVMEAVEQNQVTVFPAVPSMFGVMLRIPDEAVAKFASVRYFVSGGAAMPVALMEQLEAKFGKLVYEGDGPTECSPVTCVNPIGGKRKPASVGQVVPDVAMEIRDDRGDVLPHGEIGEICVRGPNVMKGYWNRPDDTRESFFGEWFRTGDLGYEDDEGYFFIVDRKKDMIIVNGMNVYPRIIEEALHRCPGVREVAVVGEPDARHGENVVTFVVKAEETDLTDKEIRAYCREHLGRHEQPKKIVFLDQLPRNAAGKILKRELRKSGELERGVDLP